MRLKGHILKSSRWAPIRLTVLCGQSSCVSGATFQDILLPHSWQWNDSSRSLFRLSRTWSFLAIWYLSSFTVVNIAWNCFSKSRPQCKSPQNRCFRIVTLAVSTGNV